VKLHLLSASDVRQAITMREAVEVVKSAFAQLSTGQAEVPLRTALQVPERDGVTLLMPAYLAASSDMGAKVVSVFPRNVDLGLPTIHAVVVLVDGATGQPQALLDGTYLTARRTGAVSGAATDLLARSDAQTVAVFGAGAQGRTQLAAVCAVRDIERAWVYDVRGEAAEQFVRELQGQPGMPPLLEVADSPAAAVREADVVCTATTSSAPVFDSGHVRAGTHINAVGAFTPEMQEVDVAALRSPRIVVDSRSACLAEAGDLIVPLNRGAIPAADDWTELGEIAAGQAEGRRNPGEITYFKSVGNAVQDVSVGQAVLAAARRLGLGVQVEL
jgi:ornithine cyclodeaminase